MPEVHASALIQGEVDFAEDVEIGPGCVLDASMGPITLGPGTVLCGSVYLTGPITMGRGNMVYPFACLGFAPQHVKYDASQAGRGVFIGDDNTFREHVTIHRAFSEEGPTRIGNRNFFMAGSHAGHDCVFGDDCTLVTGVMLGGHVEVESNITIGGGTVVHQFVRLGRGSMLSGGMGTSLNVPPWFLLTGNNVTAAVNLIGMKRHGFSRAQIDTVRWAHRVLCRSGLTLPSAVDRLGARQDEPLVAEYLSFLNGMNRGICHGQARAIRGSAPAE